MGITATVGEFLFADENPATPGETRDIKAFRIDFASGYSIVALSSRPRSLRGMQGKVRIDEAAFEEHACPGSGHLFADPDLPGYDLASSEEMWRRMLAFLDRVDA